jgi:uncharacterized protein (TIGR02186 family)
MMRALLAFALVIAALAPATRAAPVLTADLSTHKITLRSGSHGAAITLFGTTDAPGDIVAVVRGPETDTVVRRGPLGNFWLTAHSVAFGHVPGFYAVYATAPLDTIVPSGILVRHQLGVDNLRFQLRSVGDNPAVVQQYRAELIAQREHAGLYIGTLGKVAFVGGRLFRANIALPADAPTGSYFIEVLMLRNKALVGGETMSLVVSGTDAKAVFGGIAEWALVLYGGLALLALAVAGGVALRLRRRRPPATGAPPEP